MNPIDQQYLTKPFYGLRRMIAWLSRQGHRVSRKRIRRLTRIMGHKAIYRRASDQLAQLSELTDRQGSKIVQTARPG